MRDIELYAQILGLSTPWTVAAVELDRSAGSVLVRVQALDAEFACPTCGGKAAGYDRRTRRWRHLDTCQYTTILEADVPRVSCPEHGVVTVAVPWAEPGSGFTSLFEALVIDWLHEASIRAVSRQLRVSWGSIDRIMARAVERGMARRGKLHPERLGVDETSFQKRHEYVTVVTDAHAAHVLHVSDDRRTESLEQFYAGLDAAQKAAITGVSMDMWPAYITATMRQIPDAENKIGFDKFHVAKLLGDAVDKVRRQEHKALQAEGSDQLKGSKYAWLTNVENMTKVQRERFVALRNSTLKTARAWAIKDTAMQLWNYRSRTWARKAWERWLGWAQRCRLPALQAAARTIKRQLWGVLNAIVLGLHNGHAESMNSRIQRIKHRACGFRNRDRFRNAIYFHLGGLDLYPASVRMD